MLQVKQEQSKQSNNQTYNKFSGHVDKGVDWAETMGLVLESVLVVPCQGAAACGLLPMQLPPRPIGYWRLTGFMHFTSKGGCFKCLEVELAF